LRHETAKIAVERMQEALDGKQAPGLPDPRIRLGHQAPFRPILGFRPHE